MPEEFSLGARLKALGYTLCSVESLTGGSFSAEVTSHPGASDYFSGAAVTYSNEAKIRLGVSPKAIEAYGAVSSETASEMAEAGQRFFKTDVAISFTGNAGPSAMEGKPVGLVFIGLKIKDRAYVYKNMFSGDRSQIRKKCVEFGLQAIEELI